MQLLVAFHMYSFCVAHLDLYTFEYQLFHIILLAIIIINIM